MIRRDLFWKDIAWYNERYETYGRLLSAIRSPHFRQAMRGMAKRIAEVQCRAFFGERRLQ